MLSHSISYMSENHALIARLQYQAREADAMHERSRTMLTEAVRAGIKAGLTQVEVAKAIGRSQPEVSRLLKFHGSTPLGLVIRKNRDTIIAMATRAGVSHLRVFGSVAKGVDQSDSGVDLLVTVGAGVGLAELDQLASDLTAALGTKVYLTSDAVLASRPTDRTLAEAVAL